MYGIFVDQLKSELTKIAEMKDVLVLSSASELSRLVSEPSVAIISEGLRGEQRGSEYNRYLSIAVYLKTVIINDSATDKTADNALFDAVCVAVERLRPATYSATIHSTDDRTMTRKISFEKLTR